MPHDLDIENHADLRAYLLAHSYEVTADQPRLTNLPGGVSCRTVLVQWPGHGWVMKQALAKLRVKVDWFSDPLRIRREALGLRHLPALAPAGAITPLVFEDQEVNLLAMEAVPQPHENWKTMLLAGRLEDDHVRQFGNLIGSIHSKSAAKRDELEPLFAERGFFESLRLEAYYAYTATQVPEASTFIESLLADTRATGLALVHGDYSPKNVLVRNSQLILLDHEVIHWGDPAFDIGFSMTHLLSKAHHLADRRADFASAAQLYWDTYRAAAGGLADEGRAVRHTLACLLARVAGRSPLEYLGADERTAQRAAVIKLIQHPPTTIPQLIQEFTACL